MAAANEMGKALAWQKRHGFNSHLHHIWYWKYRYYGLFGLSNMLLRHVEEMNKIEVVIHNLLMKT
jgi:hypothetical protein